jgi:hypothetical protein
MAFVVIDRRPIGLPLYWMLLPAVGLALLSVFVVEPRGRHDVKRNRRFLTALAIMHRTRVVSAGGSSSWLRAILVVSSLVTLTGLIVGVKWSFYSGGTVSRIDCARMLLDNCALLGNVALSHAGVQLMELATVLGCAAVACGSHAGAVNMNSSH